MCLVKSVNQTAIVSELTSISRELDNLYKSIYNKITIDI